MLPVARVAQVGMRVCVVRDTVPRKGHAYHWLIYTERRIGSLRDPRTPLDLLQILCGGMGKVQLLLLLRRGCGELLQGAAGRGVVVVSNGWKRGSLEKLISIASPGCSRLVSGTFARWRCSFV